MTPAEIRNLRKMLGRTQRGMADIIETTNVTWGRWERGETIPLPVFEEKLQKLYAFAKKQEEEGEI